MNDEQARIVRYWRAVEMFSPPAVPKLDRRKRVFVVRPGEPLPWEPGHVLARERLPADRTWRHVVYVGVFGLDAVFDALSRVLPADRDSYDERPGGDSALAAFAVAADGRPLAGSEVLSSCAWATGAVLRSGSAGLTRVAGFDRARAEFSASLADLIKPDPVDADPVDNGPVDSGPVGFDFLLRCLGAAAHVVRTGSALPYGEIRVSSLQVSRRRAVDPGGHDFLSSFIADDLAAVAGQVGAGQMGAALGEYLRPDGDLDLTRRVDVRAQLGSVFDATAPRHIPLGRWPAAPGRPSALSQQLAVNSALRMPAGVLAVNGPPGTGKTTMLRDLVAAVVVERARRLAELPDPGSAFVDRLNWKAGDRTRAVHVWASQLTGFEMVVASANNGAVENVTNEIPAMPAIDEAWQPEAARLDYFADIASTLLSPDSEVVEDAGWALTAARLGNMQNRTTFKNAFWYGTSDADQHGSVSPMLAVLKGYEATPAETSWPEAVAAFGRAADVAAAMQADRDRSHAALVRRTQIEETLRAARDAQAAAEKHLAGVRARRAEAEAAAQGWQAQRGLRVQARVEHRQFRPGLLEWLTSFGRAMRAWQRRDQVLAAEVAAADDALASIRGALDGLAHEFDAATQAAARQHAAVRHGEHELASVLAVLDRAQATLGGQFPDDGWWHDRTRRELGALWTDPAWNRARTELFLAALRLHKEFIQQVPTQMRQSLQGAVDIVDGSAPRTLDSRAALAAWQALFFVVPVVSTSFASFARLFSHLRSEALGWLLVDEAGQAAPQEVVGALWRSQHAVVVGDPLQLEPITTLPFRAQQAIRADFDVDEQWLPSRGSVQSRADRLNRLGTWLPGDDGKIWVGAPLTVHRRCDQPMFGIVNDMAYDGLMINGTGPRRAEEFRDRYPTLPRSGWIDVTAAESDGHWLPDEGRQLDRILAGLRAVGVPMSRVMAVTPFRDVARQLEQRARRYQGLVAGTVHRAQGKQADVVILVLGGDPRRVGARRWAASKPNLVNVAVSRAEHRLYVIGNYQAWAPHRHFDVLADRLPRSQAE